MSRVFQRSNTDTLCRELFKGLDCPSSSQLHGYLEKGDYGALIGAEVFPSQYCDRDEFMRDWVSVNLLSKFSEFDLGIDRDSVAMDKFRRSEEICRETNLRLSRHTGNVISFHSPLAAVINSAQGKIRRLLSDFSTEELLQNCHFSSGASLDTPKRKGDSWYKYGLLGPSTTGANAGLANWLIRQFPQWETTALDFSRSSCGLSIVRGNRITTVPKNAKTNRVIAIEPTMNMIIQKGFGSILRKRLRTVGINLNDQGINQELARAGSIDGSLATIDLSMASDTIATGLVELLLPEDWVLYLKSCRSEYALCSDGTEFRYQKFSSMGNGYTFELESLIFWALAEACTELGGSDRRLSVYGDDIIVPVHAAAVLIECLSYCGFTCNSDKTFIFGPFRESCGKHYFLGSEVTPIYIKDRVDSLERKLWLANRIRDLAFRLNGCGYGMDGGLRPVWDKLVASLPKKHQKPSIPRNFGDGGLVGDFDEVVPPRARDGHEGYVVKHLIRVPDRKPVGGIPALIKTLREGRYQWWDDEIRLIMRRRAAKTASGCRAEVRGVPLCDLNLVTYKLRTVKSVTLQWVGHGPWLARLTG